MCWHRGLMQPPKNSITTASSKVKTETDQLLMSKWSSRSHSSNFSILTYLKSMYGTISIPKAIG